MFQFQYNNDLPTNFCEPVKQLELFSDFKPNSAKPPQLAISLDALHSWKQRI
jgi:hypothetical protein